MSKFFQVRTKPWKTTLLVLFAFVVFLIIWLLIGDMNLLQQNYLIAVDAPVWKGTITNDNVVSLSERYYAIAGYSSASDFLPWLQQHIGEYCQILNKSGSYIFDPIILAWMFGGVALTVLLPIVLRLCKQVNWDVLPFSMAMTFSGFIFIISGLIPQTSFQDGNVVWLWVIRVVILIVTYAIFFFSINAIVVSAMAHSKYASQYINQLKEDKLADDMAKKESIELVDMYIKDREKNAVTYIDVKEDVKEKKKS